MEKIIVFLTLISSVLGANSTYYSSFYGKKLNSSQVATYTANNTLANCTTLVAACNSSEPRRIDGTCNNLKKPYMGASNTPPYRLLPADFYHPSAAVWEKSLAVDGSDKPLERLVVKTIWGDGRVEDELFTSLFTHFAVLFATDFTNTRDTSNYLSWRTYCCQEKGKTESACSPNYVPANDFVHRFSGITCLNMTRPLSYQTSGCISNTTAPTRILDATPNLDLSPIYGNKIEPGRRNYTGGLLNTEVVNGRSYPETTNTSLLLGINYLGIVLMWRYHNYIATELAKVNPHWTDEQLFTTAREINIAVAGQIFLYEYNALLLGSDNLVADNILACDSGYREVYNSSLSPQIAQEYLITLRYLHHMQDGTLKMYFVNGTYYKSIDAVNLTSNIGYLKQEDNIIHAIQGFFRQPAANSKDSVMDPDMTQKGLGVAQKSVDIITNDLAKGRLSGIKNYVYYRAFCFDDNITSFDDLIGIIEPRKILQLKELYKNVADIDLQTGIWVETLMDNSHVPPTFYCIVTKQMNRTITSDRHWYERSDRPNAFSTDQLAEIRKATASGILCAIGENVTEIQPRSFELAGDDNVMVSCDDITSLDFTVWADDS